MWTVSDREATSQSPSPCLDPCMYVGGMYTPSCMCVHMHMYIYIYIHIQTYIICVQKLGLVLLFASTSARTKFPRCGPRFPDATNLRSSYLHL